MSVLIAGLLVFTAGCCWVGVLGMARMRVPLEALHFLALPASLGIISVAVAVWLQMGAGQVALKTTLIAAILLLFNSVVTHATARAFRLRELGHIEATDPRALDCGKPDLQEER